MNKKALSLAICAALALPTITGALSLGEIESNSNLNQPFRGKINLLSTNAAEAKSLRVRIAPPAVFNRVGIDRPAFLNSLRFRTTVQNGKPVIMVSSNQPINEPFLNFLLEISWPNGQLLKEYTVLLDPPVLMTPNTAIASNTAGVRSEPGQNVSKANQDLYRQAQQLAQQTQQQQRRVVRAPQGQAAPRRAAPVRRTSAVTNYRVRRGDTLNKIAKKLGYRGVSKDQMLLALFEKNKKAFIANNMNSLKANVVLQRPTLAHAKSVTRGEARKTIIGQARAWKKANATQAAKKTPAKATTVATNKDQARMEVSGSTDSAKAAALAASGKASVDELRKQLVATSEALESRKKANEELKSRVAEMESLLRKKNRLISMKSQQLTKLQESISGKPAVVTEGSDIEVTVKGQTEGEGTGTIVRPQTEEAPIKAVAEDANAKDATAATPETATTTESAEAAIIADAQKKAEEAKAAAEEKLLKEKQLARQKAAAAAESESASGIMGLLDSPDALKYGAGGGAALALLGGLWFMRRRNSYKEFSAEDYAEENAADIYSEENEDYAQIKSDFAAASHEGFDDTVEVIQDADVDESATGSEEDDLLQEADVYIVYGLYDQAESELKEAISKSPNNLAYRKKLLESYKASGDVASFEKEAEAFSDLDVDGKGEHWEQISEWGSALSPNNKLFSGSVAAASAGVAMMAGTASPQADSNEIDLDSLLDDDAAAVSAEEFENIDLDAILSEDMATDDMGDESLIADIDDLDLGEADFAVSSLDTNEVVVEEAEVAEFDLDAEIGSLDSLLDEAVAEETGTADSLEPTEEVATFGLDMADNEIDLDMGTSGIDIDMEAPSLDLGLDVDSKGVDNILSSDSAYKSAEVKDDNLLSDFDDNLSFLDLDADETVEETQIESKIDLAKAYIDMGDIEGARSTLEEVMLDGSEEQKLEAEELLHHTG